MNRIFVVLTTLFLAVAPSLAVADEPAAARRLTLDQALQTALDRNPDVVSAGDEIDAAVAARSSARGNFGPRVRVEGNALVWDRAYSVSFVPAGVVLPAPFDQLAQPTVVHEENTASFTATVAQPILSLWSIYEGYRVRDLGVDIARVRRDATRRDTAYQTAEAFYRLLQAMRVGEVAATSVEQLESQVRRAESFHNHGLVGQNDVLRAQLGLAAARQKLIQSRGNVTLARGRLALVLGASADTIIEPVEPSTEPPARESLTVEQAERQALAGRVELRELEARVNQANAGVRAAWSKMLPQVNAIASYQRSTGFAQLQQSEAAFVGVQASWDVWEWGATYYGTDEARARLRQAINARARIRDALRLETRAAYVADSTAAEALVVARAAVTQAEENYRIESRRYEANANTTFDVLDAEALLTQARAQQAAVLYDSFIARAALRRAMGETPVASGGASR